eukprot:TRINITY_DN2117_c0_g4_i1.p1 TRINITY_DN2117_c0_g4~~TRINITY_DN2117_c0_g4_i1.p1  ORF type:complete len:161 (+),score=8.09 TRINITY_DN2117_c0_g4_i1:73-555(+)
MCIRDRSYNMVIEDNGCGICALEYSGTLENAPRVMQCGHSFCTKCIERLGRQGQRICPNSRSPLSISWDPHASFRKMLLPVNMDLLNALKISISKEIEPIDAQTYEELHRERVRNFMPRFQLQPQPQPQLLQEYAPEECYICYDSYSSLDVKFFCRSLLF